jgi:hypothetical protein
MAHDEDRPGRPTRRDYQRQGAIVEPPISAVLSRHCPRCGAQPGHRCRPLRRRDSAATVPLTQPHRERRRQPADPDPQEG